MANESCTMSSTASSGRSRYFFSMLPTNLPNWLRYRRSTSSSTLSCFKSPMIKQHDRPHLHNHPPRHHKRTCLGDRSCLLQVLRADQEIPAHRLLRLDKWSIRHHRVPAYIPRLHPQRLAADEVPRLRQGLCPTAHDTNTTIELLLAHFYTLFHLFPDQQKKFFHIVYL